MTAFIVPTAEALALNAHLAIVHGYPIQFAYEESFGWVHDSNAFAGLDPQVLEDAVVALEYANSVADYLAPLEMLFQRHCKVYRYLPGEWDRLTPPVTIDYRTGLDRRLERKETFVKGELTMVEYFATASILSDGTLTFSDRVVVENYTYNRDTAGYALSRELKIQWVLENDSLSPTTKTLKKTYSPEGRILEGKRRRANVVNELELTVSNLLVQTEASDPTDPAQVQAALDLGRNLMREYHVDIGTYVEGSLQDLYNRLEAESSFPWLDNPVSTGGTIRAVMLDAINIWGL